MSTSFEIFSKVNEYMESQVTLCDLESWLVNMLPIYLVTPNSSAAELAGLIELGLSEIKAGIRTERGFRRILSKHLNFNPVRSVYYPWSDSITVAIASGSVEDATNWDWVDLSPSWSIEPQEECV